MSGVLGVDPFDAHGRREGVRRKVIKHAIARSRWGHRWMRMTLECGHTAHRRYEGAPAIWAICDTCTTHQKLDGEEDTKP